MKTIIFLEKTTLFEMILNGILLVVFLTGLLTGNINLAGYVLFIVGGLHLTSMLLHWLAWNKLERTHTARVVFNLWVGGTLALLLTNSFLGLYLLLIFSAFWFAFYVGILYHEYVFLKRKHELYEQRELIHF